MTCALVSIHSVSIFSVFTLLYFPALAHFIPSSTFYVLTILLLTSVIGEWGKETKREALSRNGVSPGGRRVPSS